MSCVLGPVTLGYTMYTWLSGKILPHRAELPTLNTMTDRWVSEAPRLCFSRGKVSVCCVLRKDTQI